MEKREHDLFLDMASNPNATIDNLIVAGVNANNTALQDRVAYEQDDWVKSQFQNQYGQFDKVKFDTFYNNVKMQYNALANADYNESMKKQVSYHRDNIFAPIEQRRKGPDLIELKMINPYQTTSSIFELGKTGERTKSIDELAQTYKVLLNPTTAGENLENAQWGDAPNDNFWGYFTDTLVLAEDEKGEPKVSPDGHFYYEKLDGRSVYGKKVLNKMNVLTTDGSFWNKYDFFDSDDIKQKSIVGSTLKNLALVGTMFIPYVGPWIAGLSVASQTAGLLGTLGKMFVGSDSPTLSALEGWAKSVNRQTATSEYAQEHPWCWENMINLVGDVVGQLAEQRFIFEKVPYVFKGANMSTKEGQAAKLKQLTDKYRNLNNTKIASLKEAGATESEILKTELSLNNINVLNSLASNELNSFIKGYNNLGALLSKGYMTAITVGDTYGEAKLAGASDFDATLLTLGYAAGEYALLSTGLGEWIMPELRAGRYRSQAIAKALTKIDDETKQSVLQTAREEFAKTSIKEGKKQYVKKLFNIGKNLAKDVYTAEKANGTRTLSATLASATGEGVEEVSEELLADFSKGCYDVVKWLQGEDTRLNSFGYNFQTNEWDGSEILNRYSMSLIGGFIGGGVTNAATNYKTIKSYDNMTNQEAIQQLVYMSRNGEIDDFMKSVNKMQLGNKNLSTNYEIINELPTFSPGTKEDNQDVAIKNIIQKQVNIIQNILSANGAVSDIKFLDKQILGDLRFAILQKSATAGLYLQTYNSLLSNIVQDTNQLNSLLNSAIDTNNDGKISDVESRKNKLSDTEKTIVKNLEENIKKEKKQLQDLLEGKSALDFVSTSLFETTTALSSIFTNPTFPLFAENLYHKKYNELTEDEKQKALNQFENWKSTDGREQFHILAQIYRQIAEQSSKTIKKHESDYTNTPQELTALNNVISNFYTITNINGQTIVIPQIYDDSDFLAVSQIASNAAFSGNRKIYNNAVQSIFKNKELDPNLALISNTLVNLLATEDQKIVIQNIQNRVSQIDEMSQEESQDIVNDYIEELDDILISNVINFVQPVLDRGFANEETKNQLTQLLTLAHNVALTNESRWNYKFEEGEIEVRLGENPINPYSQLSKDIFATLHKVEKLNATPIEQNLNEFAISIGKDPINLTQLITRLNASFNDFSDNITQFNIDSELATELNNAISTLQLYQASIMGARTDNANLDNLFGYNATINEVASKLKDVKKPELAEIDKTVADVFIADIQANLNKLLFLKKLYTANQGQKLSKQDRVSTKKDLLIYKRLKNIVTIRDDDDLKNWEGFLDLQSAISNMTIHDQLLSDNNHVVEESQREAFEKEKLSAEDAIYNFFQKNKNKLDDTKELVKLINPDRFQLYTEADELLNEGLENLDDNSIIWWMATRAALRASDFYFQYKSIINPDSDKPLAPISTQELAIYNNYASVVNGDIFNKFYKAYRQAMFDNWQVQANETVEQAVERRKKILKLIGKEEFLADESVAKSALNFLPRPMYSNIVLTEGAPGTGKSVGVFQPTLKLLNTFNKEALKNVAVVHGANPDSAKTLRDNIELNDKNSKTFGRESFMKAINPNWKEYSRDEKDYYQIPDSDYTVTSENEIRSNSSVIDTQNPFSLIVIDEISKFSSYDLDQINAYAQKYGITVLVAGDFDQSGVIGQHSLNKIPEFKALLKKYGYKPTYDIELSRTDFIRSPKLGVSMRTDNTLKTINLSKLQAFIKQAEGQIDFNYYEDKTGLYGDKVISYSDTPQDASTEILKYIQTMIDTSNGEKIGFIYSSKTSPLYQILNTDKYRDFIDFKEGGSAQGLEGKYYIIEANTNVSSREYLRDIYTGISRAQQGSIVIVPSIYNKIRFTSNAMNSKISEELKTNVIANFARKRKSLLDKVIVDGKVSPIISRNTEQKKPEQKKQPTLAERKAQLLQAMEDAEDIADLDHIVELAKQNDSELGNDPEIIEAHKRLSEKFAPTNDYKQEKESLLTAIYNVENIEDIDRLIQETGINDFNRDPDVIKARNNKISSILSERTEFKFRKPNANQITKPYYFSSIVNQLGDKLFSWEYYGYDVLRKYNGILYSTGKYYQAVIEPAITFAVNSKVLPKKYKKYLNNTRDNAIELEDLYEIIQYFKNLGVETPVDLIKYVNENAKIDETVSSKEEKTIYDDDISPITESTVKQDIINEQEYQKQIDDNTKSKVIPESTVDVTPSKKSILITMLLHSFNTFETGVAFDEYGNPISFGDDVWMDCRIDSVNGLIKIDKLLNRNKRNKQQYLQLLGDLRNILFNVSDKSQIQEKIQSLLGLPKIYCTFALKSSPRIDKNAKLTDGYFGSPTPFVKNVNDKTEFNYSTDERSREWHNKSIVAIIGTEENNNLLELPLLALSSPFTLLQTKDENGNRVFNEVFETYKQLREDGKNLHEISEELVTQYRDNVEYSELIDLFELYNFTSAGVFYIEDQLWTPVRNLQTIGSKFITEKGYYQEAPGFSMNDIVNPEENWLTLAEFKQNPQITMTDIMVSTTGKVDGLDKQIVNAGHSFVLVSFNKKHNTDTKIIEQYIKQQRDSSVREEVKLMYVLPPKANLDQYLNNLHKIFNKDNDIEYIGNLFTSYRLLQVLMQNDEFKTTLERKVPHSVELVQQAFELLKNKSVEEQANILYSNYDGVKAGFGNHKLAGLFDAIIFNVAYTHRSLNDKSFEQDQNGTNLIKSILTQAGINGVYHKVRITRDMIDNGYFITPYADWKSKTNKNPLELFKIHGKLDSYTFKGWMGGFIKQVLSKKQPGKNSFEYSTDNKTYVTWSTDNNGNRIGLPGNSNLNPTWSKQEIENERIINNTINTVKNKLNIDVSSIFQGKTIQEAQSQIIQQINSENNQVVAFTIGNELFISNKSLDIEGPVYIYDANNEPITDISATVDNNGNYNFVISTIINSKQIKSNCTYNNRELEIELPIEEAPSLVLSVTPENFSTYVETGRRLLESMFEYEPDLEAVFGANTYEEFINILYNMDYADRISDYEDLLNDQSSDLQKQIVQDLINIENYIDPFKQTIDKKNTCPTSIKIKF